jgi:phage terminase large subunit
VKVKVDFLPEIFNESFYDVYNSHDRFLNCVGGAGSGKSISAAQKIIIRLLNENEHRFLLLRKVERTIRNSQYQLFKDLIADYSLEQFFKYRDGDLSISCPSTGGNVFSAGLDNVEKLKSFAKITGTWVEEATELTKNDFTQVNMRMRGISPYYKQHILTYNPIDEFHWLNHKFFIKGDPNSKILQTTFEDNKFLDKEYIEELRKLQKEDPTLWKIYGLGVWATAMGLIFQNWTESEKFPQKFDDLIYGLDFGYTNPTALMRIGRIGDDLYIEEKVYQSHLTNRELIDIMKGNSELYKDKVIIYPDNEDPNRIKELQDAGFRMGKVDKDVIAGLEYCRRFKFIIKSNSGYTKKEIRTYKYKQDARTGLWLEHPVSYNDHAMTAVRYGVFSHGKRYWKVRQFTKSSSVRHKREREDITANY